MSACTQRDIFFKRCRWASCFARARSANISVQIVPSQAFDFGDRSAALSEAQL
jgi:hypothetical protein